MTNYKASYYNRRVDYGEATLLYNGKTGALFNLSPEVVGQADRFLGPRRPLTAGTGYEQWAPKSFGLDELPDCLRTLWASLFDAGVFIAHDADERMELQRQFLLGRERGPLIVTVTSTLNCNMRCYYCYQKDDALEEMSTEVCDDVIAWTKRRISDGGHSRLFMDWYGGEPMLNRGAIERISDALIPFCDTNGVKYNATMVCNGTAWPSDVDRFVRDIRLQRVQFSMDGPERFHNKRRGIFIGHSKARVPSYDAVMETLDRVIGKTFVSLRINVDPMIDDACLELIDVMSARGWLRPGLRFYPYVASIHDMTEHCDFIGRSAKFDEFKDRFNDIKNDFFSLLSRHQGKETLEWSSYYPRRRLINCGAISENTIMFGPDGSIYKCGLEVGDLHRSLGSISTDQGSSKAEPSSRLPADRWRSYDPFSHPRCKECQYLPLCLGGCPKAHMDGNEREIAAQSAFFEGNFESAVRSYADAPI